MNTMRWLCLIPTVSLLFLPGVAHAQQWFAYQYLGQPPSGHGLSWSVSDVNDAGVVVGTESYGFEGVVGYSGLAFNRPAQFVNLNWNLGINNRNEVAGAVDVDTNTSDAYVSPRPAVTLGGVRTLLGTSDGFAYDVNDAGMVVGVGAGHGSLWTWDSSTGLYRTLVEGSETRSLDRPRINVRGQVAAGGTLYTPGEQPVSVPAAYTSVAGLNDAGDMLVNTPYPGTPRSLLRMSSGATLELSSLVGGQATVGYGLTNLGAVIFRAGITEYIWSQMDGLRILGDITTFPQFGTERYSILDFYAASDDGHMVGLTYPYYASGGTGSSQIGLFSPVPAPAGFGLLAIAVGLMPRRRHGSK